MNLIERDRKHVWHPLTQYGLNPEFKELTKAKGVYLYDDKGNKYIDTFSSWYTCMYGHCNPYIVGQLTEQAQNLDQVVFTGFTHTPAVELSEKLIEILPNNQQKIFFSENGSTSVEVALKMAIQFHANKGIETSTFIAFDKGFHGDTFGAMSVSGLAIYNGSFKNYFVDVERIPLPNSTNWEEVISRIEKISQQKSISAFIYEPLIQGAAGMKMYPSKLLNKILKYCKQKGILLIADEVMTGLGKTGKCFASDYIDTKPDFICMAKSLTAGMMPLAVTSCTQEIFNSFVSKELDKGFFHAHTYSGNPLACRVALAALHLLQSEEIQRKIKMIEQQHSQFLDEIKEWNEVKDIRTMGVFLAIELNIDMDRYGEKRNQLFQYFMENGLFLRPLGNVIYISPPYIITQKELEKIYSILKKAILKF